LFLLPLNDRRLCTPLLFFYQRIAHQPALPQKSPFFVQNLKTGAGRERGKFAYPEFPNPVSAEF
jgi:hypothetical protein